MLHRVAICYKPDGNALEQHGNALEQKKNRSSPHKLYLCRRNKKYSRYDENTKKDEALMAENDTLDARYLLPQKDVQR